VEAGDAGTGIARIELVNSAGDVLDSKAADCSAQCPGTWSTTFSVPHTDLTGTDTDFTVRASNADGGSGTASFDIKQDDTAPDAVSGFSATFDPGTNQTDLTWDAAEDPPSDNGAPASEVESYEYRYQRGSGDWTEWDSTDAPDVVLPDSFSGESISLEVKAIDQAGNVSEISTGQDTAEATQVTVGDPGSAGATDPDASVSPEADDGGDGTSDPHPPVAFPAAGPQPDLCVISPCGSYNGRAAAAYAVRWYNHHNKLFWSFVGDGGDCTNFSSQALHAGGMRFMRAGGLNNVVIFPDDRVQFSKGQGSWWAIRGFYSGYYEWTASWVNAELSHDRLLDSGLAVPLDSGDRPQPGDIVYYKLQGLDKAWDHSQVVTRVTHTQVYVAQHSPGYNKSFAKVLASAGQQYGHLGTDWTYQFVRPVHAAANI
jgi:hypothetical protein